jgi:arylformamidase
MAIDQVSPSTLIGECVVIEGDRTAEKVLDRQALEEYYGQGRILIRSGHSDHSMTGNYQDHTELMTPEAASHLLEGGMVLLGTDRLSVDASDADDFTLHRILLEAGCVIVEGLALEHAPIGKHSLIILPLRLAGADASPARALLAP